MAADERRQEAAMADEREQRQWTKGNKSKGKRWPIRRKTRGNDQWSDLIISHKIGQWQQTRGDERQ